MSLYGSIIARHHILPQLLFNMDETPMTLTDQYKYSELMMVDGQQPSAITPERMANVTVLLTIPAVGTRLPTVLLWPAKTIPKELNELRAYDILVLPSEIGWQTIASFQFIMKTIIIPAIINKRRFLNCETEMALLVLDSHSSRLTSEVWRECAAQNIIAVTIPSHTSHFLQPLDCGPNGTMKKVCFYEMIHALNPPPEGVSVSQLLATPASPRSPSKFMSPQTKPTDTTSMCKSQASPTYILAWQRTKEWIDRLSELRTSRISFHPCLSQQSPVNQTQSTLTPTLQKHTVSPVEIPSLSPAVTEKTVDDVRAPDPVLRIRGGNKPQRKNRKAGIDDNYQPPADEKSDACLKRSLFVYAFPIALDRATDKASVQAAWRNSGLYPINSTLVQTHLHPGPAYHVSCRDLPLIAGRVLTDSSVIESIETLEKKREQKKAEETRSKKTTELIQTTSRSRRTKALEELAQSMETGPSASFWMPRLSKVITDASISTQESALASASTEASTDTFIEPGPILTTELRDEPDIVILPAFDNSTSEDVMNNQTMD